VVPDPNTVFTDITNIYRVQEEARRFDSDPVEEEAISKSKSEDKEVEDYIITTL
jgi:hypothetical protein